LAERGWLQVTYYRTYQTTPEEILQDLEIYRDKFAYSYENWVILKNSNEFAYGINHQSPIREMFAEGSGTAWYLKIHLDTSKVNKGLTISNYIRAVKSAIPPRAHYLDKGQQAQRGVEDTYPENHTVRFMLRQYWHQWNDIEEIERLMTALSVIRPPLLSPLMVIRQYVMNWERDAQLHQGIGEEGLRSQLVHALRETRYSVNSEVYSYQGHADIVVNRWVIQAALHWLRSVKSGMAPPSFRMEFPSCADMSRAMWIWRQQLSS
jgi:hypothetical protein